MGSLECFLSKAVAKQSSISIPAATQRKVGEFMLREDHLGGCHHSSDERGKIRTKREARVMDRHVFEIREMDSSMSPGFWLG